MMKNSINKKIKGFTLIELVIVLAILGILLAILVPSISGYMKLAKKRANVANAKTIYLQAIASLTASEKAYDSFYYYRNTKGASRPVSFEATPDGKIVMTQTTYNDKTNTHSKKYKSNDKKSNAENYLITVVARVDGKDHATDGTWANPSSITNAYNTWSWTDGKYETFVKCMCNDIEMAANIKNKGSKGGYSIRMPYNARDDGGTLPLVRWLIVYNWDEPDQVEVWAGDGYMSANGPAYRVYPKWGDNY